MMEGVSNIGALFNSQSCSFFSTMGKRKKEMMVKDYLKQLFITVISKGPGTSIKLIISYNSMYHHFLFLYLKLYLKQEWVKKYEKSFPAPKTGHNVVLINPSYSCENEPYV